MIRARYKDGRTYEARNIDDIDFREFVIDNLIALEVHGWHWCQYSHGAICFHGLRTVKTFTDQVVERVYCLVTDTWKLCFLRSGELTALRHWIKGHALFDEMNPGRPKEPSAVNKR